jgi:hypothetical protein
MSDMEARSRGRLSVRFLPRVLLALGAAATLPSCGDVNGDATETVRGELGDFGPWVSAGGPTLIDAPALAKGQNTTLTAFGWGSDFQIWTTAQNANGQWTGVWTALPGGTVASRPAAVAMNSGPFAGHFVLAALRSDGHVWLRIQDQTGSDVAYDWRPLTVYNSGVPYSPTFFSAPAITFAAPFPDNVGLFVAGLGYSNRIDLWVLPLNSQADLLTDNWWGVSSDPGFVSAPALAYLPPSARGQEFIYLAAGVEGPYGTTYKTTTRARMLDFLPWQDVPNANFISGPALAVAGPVGVGMEMTLYGVGLDSRVYASTQIPNGGFSQLSPQIVGGNPSALGVGRTVSVSALINGNAYVNHDKYYSYQVYQFDDRSSWGYQGAGDWAFSEFKGGCAANQWSMGVSASIVNSSRAHSLLCTSAAPGSPTSFTSALHTLNISAANDGYGTHLNYDWDAGFYKGECAPNEVVVGLSQSPITGALRHVRCAAAAATATNCRAVIGDNQESPGDPIDWASGYRKTACRKGSAVAGVSRGTVTGGVHAILCCDFAGL